MSTSTSTALVHSTPSTPATKPTIAQTLPLIPSPGTWRHPKFNEIIDRQANCSFTDRNRRSATTNAIILVLSLFLGAELKDATSSALSRINVPQSQSTLSWTLNLFRLLLLINIGFTLRPVLPYLKTKDEILDIPLTPSQRALLGLPVTPISPPESTASSTTGTPNYITPPRYRRSPGSLSSSPKGSTAPTDRRSISANYTPNNPFSTPRQHISPSFSPSSTSPLRSTYRTSSLSTSASNSPLLHRAVFGKTRESFGTSTSTNGLGRSQSVKDRSVWAGVGAGAARDARETASPSPTHVKRTTGLNYKWLYERGRTLPRSESLHF